MYEMSLYSTPIEWRALVAGPVNGEVVASWRKTSKNDFSSGVRILISRPSLLCLLVCVCLPDFMGGPVIGILNSRSYHGRITLQRSARGDSLKRGPLCGLVHVPSHQRDPNR